MTDIKFVPLLLSILVFIVIDMIWLGFVANRLYYKKLSYLATVKNNSIVFNLPVGILTQALIAAGLFVVLTLATRIYGGPNLSTIAIGAFVSFVMYATYDLTSLSFVKGWPIDITIIDLLWGTAQGIFAGLYVPYLLHYFR